MIELVDETAAKIVLATTPGDSIRRVARKIDGTYSWIHEWVTRLEASGIVSREDGLHVENYEARGAYDQLIAALARSIELTPDEAYTVPHFSGLPFAFTRIDAAYVWTHGGYQIARGHDDYPVFLRVEERDVKRWVAFFDRYGVPSVVGERADPDEFDEAVYYVMFPTSGPIEREWVDGRPVVPLDETVDHMLEYRVNYEPALEMVADEYDVDVDAAHDDPALRP